MAQRILIVDDEKDILQMLEYNLKNEGFWVSCAQDGKEALQKIKEQGPDLVILDLMLPEIDGLEVCKILKKDPRTAHLPIIMLTAKSQEVDKIVGLELGADDYITKPFSLRELIARIKAVLRRIAKKGEAEILKIGNLTIDLARIQVSIKNKPLNLTTKEFELLKTLIQAKGRVLSRDYLLETVWGFDQALEIQTRTVDVHIRTLRKKLKQEAKRILTVKNYGYRFALDEG